MNILHKNNWFKTLAAVLTLGIASGLHPVAAQEDEDDDEEVFDLSPFTVQEDEAIGYQALSTLAGTRIKTDLRDVGAAISVITQEFMEDTGATDAGTLLSYGLNTEVSGKQGNFAGPSLGGAGGINAGDPTLDNQRANPQENAQRVRGLAAASITPGIFPDRYTFRFL
jgi:outer membrane receptor protein involved in Fe transport